MNFKKIISLVLVFAMCLSMIPTYAFAGDECFDHWYDGIAVEPGCVTQGYTVYQCPNCGDWYEEYTDPLGHNLTWHDAVEPTEYEPGNSAYGYCETCGKYFADEYAEYEIGQDSCVIPAFNADESGDARLSCFYGIVVLWGAREENLYFSRPCGYNILSSLY